MNTKFLIFVLGMDVILPAQGAIWNNVNSAQVQAMGIAHAFLYNGTGTVSLPSVTASYYCGLAAYGNHDYSSCSGSTQFFPMDYYGPIFITGKPYMIIELPGGWTVSGGGASKLSGGYNFWYIPYGGNYSGTLQAKCTANSTTQCFSSTTLQQITLPGSGAITVRTTEPDGDYTFVGKVSMFIDPLGMTAPMYNGVDAHFKYRVKNEIPYDPDGPNPPSPVICTNKNTIQINHGTILLAEVNGHQRTEKIDFFCTGGTASAILTLQGNSYEGLSLIDVGKNVLSKNGVSMQQDSAFVNKLNTTFKSGTNTVFVRSVLTEKAGGAKAGGISGIDLLRIEYN
ncbi:hypothetical protein JRK18_003820 [Salmonella enterica]|uniref:hypothetical protein n=1 Tax=Salmonella enterica TaxID=28901 RepID=UPI000AFF152A|nr:hypothetical protein [Salmonella enterica]ECF4139124.1 hypothetical protein [Salmonella enterica subsp. enterica serovar Bareilly]EAX6576956.1 hypothetical protein [Salmonella enterica]EBP0111870.1 hypothetical protein [Salmonella enterica]EED3241160.1 hypothetical protein [Salmonella enterica subsp. enterica serovar Bareilly]EHD2110614.1 hypothetical protein [Salmonella enterica]